MPKLKKLNLSKNPLGPEGIAYLKDFKLPKLMELKLISVDLKFGIKSLALCKFPKLKNLNLEANRLGPKEIEFLVNCDFPSLKELNLNENNIGNEGLAYFKNFNFPKLTCLKLDKNAIEDLGLKAFSESEF